MTAFYVPQPRHLAWLLILFALAACNFPMDGLASEDAVATAVAATLTPQSQPMPTPPADGVLPHSVYYLSAGSGSQQVWRLDADGATQTQVTREDADIFAFDVSRANGSVAFVTHNQLYLIDADGGHRRLVVDNAAADPNAPEYVFTERISDPRFSPDGRYLAYAYDGLWILDMSNNQAVHLLQNETAHDGEELRAEVFYAPVEWAPNSLQMLLLIGSSESMTLAFVNPGAESLITEFDESNEPVCCQVAWAPDSSFALVANPTVGLIEPGLWRYVANSGAGEALLEESNDLLQFAGWPLVLPNGDLQYVYASTAAVPESEAPLFMVRSAADGETNRTQLRPDAFSNISEVLWAEDGTLALMVQRGPGGGMAGSVLLAHSDGSQLQLLFDGGQELRWGE